ncbi:hypothetical protein KJ903_01050, partial [Patescibacteria group bacterium]|nr:hypothetical protein [Patescibacteria group bacterium]
GTSGAGDGMPVKVNDDTSFLGEIWGGTSKGNTADGQSLVIADSMRPKMDVINDNGSAGYQWLNTYTKYLIASGSVTTADLNASGTVTANNLTATGTAIMSSINTSGTVTAASIDTSALMALAVDTDSLQGEYTVASVNIADGAVGTGKLADEAVSSDKIQDGGIEGTDLADGAVTSAKISDGTIEGGDIASDSDLIVGSITTNEAQFTGHARQNLGASGIVKALVYISNPSTGECPDYWTFNDSEISCQHTGALSSGTYQIDFAFDVNERFYQATPYDQDGAAQLISIYRPSDPDKLNISIQNSGGTGEDMRSMITVF